MIGQDDARALAEAPRGYGIFKERGDGCLSAVFVR